MRVYFATIRLIWTSPLWYLFLAAVFFTGMRGSVNHPIPVLIGVAFIGCVWFPLCAILMHLVTPVQR